MDDEYRRSKAAARPARRARPRAAAEDEHGEPPPPASPGAFRGTADDSSRLAKAKAGGNRVEEVRGGAGGGAAAAAAAAEKKAKAATAPSALRPRPKPAAEDELEEPPPPPPDVADLPGAFRGTDDSARLVKAKAGGARVEVRSDLPTAPPGGKARRTEPIGRVGAAASVPPASAGVDLAEEPPPGAEDIVGPGRGKAPAGWTGSPRRTEAISKHAAAMGARPTVSAGVGTEDEPPLSRDQVGAFPSPSSARTRRSPQGGTTPVRVQGSGSDAESIGSDKSGAGGLRVWCADHPNCLIGLAILTAIVVITVVAVTVSLGRGGGGDAGNADGGFDGPAIPMSTSGPTAAPTPAGPTEAPTNTPTPGPTTEYTAPPVPDVDFDPGPPATSTGSWTPLGGVINGGGGNEQFGTALGLSYRGDVLAASPPPYPSQDGGPDGPARRGVVRVHRLDEADGGGGGWVRVGDGILGEGGGDRAGEALAVSGDGARVAVASREHGGGAGQVRVFSYGPPPEGRRRAQGADFSWNQVGDAVEGSAANDAAGTSVALDLDGTTMIVGAPFRDVGARRDAGRARVFRLDPAAGRWDRVGGDIEGLVAGDQAGRSVAVSAGGRRVAVGSPENDGGGANVGHVRIFDFNAELGDWVQVGPSLLGSSPLELAGTSLALSGDGLVVAVAAIGGNSGRGAVRVYRSIQRRWEKMGQDLVGEAAWDNFGISVSLSFFGDRIVSSSIANEKSKGYARAYEYIESDDSWDIMGDTIYGAESGDNFGAAVGLSANGHRMAVSAKFTDPVGYSSGEVHVYEF